MSLSLKTGMRPKPKVMALKMWESLRLFTSSRSRPGGGGTSFLPTGPRSVEVCPWHMAQLTSKSAFPCDRDAAVGLMGFLYSACCETISLPETGTESAGGDRTGALYGL